MGVGGGVQCREEQRGEKWDNCNSIINKIYLKIKKKTIKIVIKLKNKHGR